MLKRISVVALAGLLSLPGLAMAADSDHVADLEKQMAEMNKMFNAKMQAMQDEIATLKAKNAAAPATETTSGAAATPGAAPADEWAKRVSLGGQVTFRGYNLQNVWDFNDEVDSDNWDTFRLKGSLKATVKATDDVTAVVQLTDQTYGENTGVGDNVDNKIFLDNAYIEARNLFGVPVDGTFGRQNLIYGSGFVVLDGQSQFASTSIYFDGIKLRWHLTDTMTLDGLYMKDQENQRADDADGNTTPDNRGDDITLSGAYFTSNKCPMVGKSELYILNRNDEYFGKDIWMYGARVSNKLENGFDYSLEGAIQRGDANRTLDQDAFGYKLDGGYTVKAVSMTPRFYLGYAFMSGDENASDQESNQWDVFYGGWPQFGDLMAWKYLNLPSTANSLKGVYSGYNAYSNVIGEAIYSNFSIATLGASANLLKNFSVNLSYSLLTFDEVAAGMDDDFGDYYQTTLKYQYNKQLSFSLYAALLSPGDAFKFSADAPMDDATEAYWETEYKF